MWALYSEQLTSSVEKKENNIKEVKNYSPPKKEPKIFEEEKNPKSKKLQPEKSQSKKLKTKFEEEPLILEEPLVLEEVYKEKVSKKEKKIISPAARKMADEVKADLSNCRGFRKKWSDFKRRYNEVNGFKACTCREKN